MTEDEITERLVAVLNTAGQDTLNSFVADVLGVALSAGPIEARWMSKAVTLPMDGARRGVVIGLATSNAISSSDPKGEIGEGRPDAVLTDGVTVIALEVKVREGVLVGRQLRSQGLALGFDVVDIPTDPYALPAGYGVRTWTDVADWLNDAPRTPGLADLSTLLDDESLLGSAAATQAAARPTTVAIDEPTPVARNVVLERWDLAAVRKVCLVRYGNEPIRVEHCPNDQDRMLADYAAAQISPPPGLADRRKGGAMTPERVLSVLYGHLADPRARTLLTNGIPKSWAAFRTRSIGNGADRAVLVSILAWTAAMSSATARTAANNVLLVWSQAPEFAPGLDEFHEALKPAQRPGY